MRRLPAVNAVLQTAEGQALVARFSREMVVRAIRAVLGHARERARAGEDSDAEPYLVAIEARRRLERAAHAGPRRIINATGVVLHTGLGRAPLDPRWLVAGYCDLEVSRETGERGNRLDLVRDALTWLTGAEDALVVNNNAAATLLAVDTLARGREVVVARGQLVEIGGSFRMPDVVAASGARLVEVGTTNRVRIEDYRRALSENTGAILKVHPSNFRVIGFTESVGVAALSELARETGVPLIYDIGSGCLLDTRRIPGLENEPPEPRVDEAVRDGADIVCFSGDKLLGGPQAGVLVGRSDFIVRLWRNPLYRALRVDKLVLSALGGCLSAHMSGDGSAPPAVSLLLTPDDELRGRAEDLAEAIRAGAAGARVAVQAGEAAAGSGSLPGTTLRSWWVVVTLDSPEQVARRLRMADPGVFCLVRDSALVLDLRTVLPWEVEELGALVVKALCAGSG